MLNIDFEFDEAGFDASAQAFEDGVMRPSLVDAVNLAAAHGMGRYLESSLRPPFDFTREAGGYLEAEPDDSAPAVLVFVKRRQVSYLGYEVYSSTKTAEDPETLAGDVLMPAQASTMTVDGNLHLDEVLREMGEANTRWLAIGPPGNHILRRGNGLQLVFWSA